MIYIKIFICYVFKGFKFLLYNENKFTTKKWFDITTRHEKIIHENLQISNLTLNENLKLFNERLEKCNERLGKFNERLEKLDKR